MPTEEELRWDIWESAEEVGPHSLVGNPKVAERITRLAELFVAHQGAVDERIVAHELGDWNEFVSEFDSCRSAWTLVSKARAELGSQATQRRLILQTIDIEAKRGNGPFVLALDRVTRCSCFASWDSDQRAAYRLGYQVLALWRDCFISFTRSNVDEINEDYEPLARSFGLDPASLSSSSHLVARIVFKQFRSENIKSFLDEESLERDQNLKHSISKGVRTAVVMLQLIETESFANKDPNWTWEEFKIASESNEERTKTLGVERGGEYRPLLVLSDPDDDLDKLLPANFPVQYKDWVAKLRGQFRLKMSPDSNKREVKRSLRELAREVVRAREALHALVLDL